MPQRNKLWNDFCYLSANEKVRVRHCCGCKYLTEVAAYGCCTYYLETGKRRPCKFGQKCPVKVLMRGYKLPDNYDAWCAEWDKKIAAKKAEEERKVREREEAIRALITESDERAEAARTIREASCESERERYVYNIPSLRARKAPIISNKRGPKCSWDVDYAFSLYCAGYYICDIEDIMQINGTKLRAYIENHGWRDIEDRNRNFHRADIKAERKKYLTWKKRKEEYEARQKELAELYEEDRKSRSGQNGSNVTDDAAR